MNMNRRIKPNLVDPKISRKISRTINPPKKDYWAPTKSTLQSFYETYIRPNFYFFLFIFVLICFLLYRYRIVQDERLEQELVPAPVPEYFHVEQNQSVNTNPAKIYTKSYTDLLLDVYSKSKELSYEPKINTSKKTNRVDWAPQNKKINLNSNPHLNMNPNLNPNPNLKPKFAYPMYPFVKGGSLLSPSKR